MARCKSIIIIMHILHETDPWDFLCIMLWDPAAYIKADNNILLYPCSISCKNNWGSVLGPLLFIIYLNDVVHCISNSSKMNLFADAIALYRIIRSFDDYSSLQADIDAVSNCLAGKYLTLNPSKCCHLFISRKRIRSISPPSLTLNGHKLTHYKYLGVLINSDLVWSTHISKVCNKTRNLSW